MTNATKLCTAQKLHPAQMSWRASLPPTTGEEGGGSPCSSRSEASAPLMAGPHARIMLRTLSTKQSMSIKYLILFLTT